MPTKTKIKNKKLIYLYIFLNNKKESLFNLIIIKYGTIILLRRNKKL